MSPFRQGFDQVNPVSSSSGIGDAWDLEAKCGVDVGVAFDQDIADFDAQERVNVERAPVGFALTQSNCFLLFLVCLSESPHYPSFDVALLAVVTVCILELEWSVELSSAFKAEIAYSESVTVSLGWALMHDSVS